MNTKREAVRKYIAKIRNERKRAYATAWANHAIGFQPAPDEDQFNPLGGMARQAVRMEIRQLLGDEYRA